MTQLRWRITIGQRSFIRASRNSWTYQQQNWCLSARLWDLPCVCNGNTVHSLAVSHRIVNYDISHTYLDNTAVIYNITNTPDIPKYITEPWSLWVRDQDLKFQGLLILLEISCTRQLHLHDVIWWQRTGSTLAQVMGCCQTALSHYLNQCWLIISEVKWKLPDGNFTRDTLAIQSYHFPKNSFKSPRTQMVKVPLSQIKHCQYKRSQCISSLPQTHQVGVLTTSKPTTSHRLN